MNLEQRIRTFEGERYVPDRLVPIPKLLITATTSGGAQTLLTVATGQAFEIVRLVVANITGSAATLTLHAVPSGGSIANGNAELVGYSVAANSPVDLTDWVQGLYPEGATLQAWSGTGSALVLSGYGKQIV